jgi:enoyl-CoA hydratase/carnithine racemase
LHETFFEQEYTLDQYIHTYPKPVLALLDGLVLGGGMGLVQGADLRVITERTRMGMPEVGIGYFPDVGGSYFLSRLQGELGTYLGVTGIHVRAADALFSGLADYCISSDKLSMLLDSLDTVDWDGSTALTTLQAVIEQLAVRKLPGAELKTLLPAINQHFAHDKLTEVKASLQAEHRPEYQSWAEEVVSILSSRSPLAMAVTLALLRRGAGLTLAQCLTLELHLDRQWFAKGDIVEGVRALLIDKDKQPKWNPPKIEQVDDARVAAFFVGFNAVA